MHQDTEQIRAESYIREHTALYRHYRIGEVQNQVRRFCSINLTDKEAIAIVEKVRNEKRMGKIADYNMPGYQEKN